jgi:DNA primase
MLKGRQEAARYAYKDADSNILGYVVRLEDKQGNKITPTLTYCQNDKGEIQWRWQGFGNDRPLYGLDQLKQKSEAPVLIVEGEKTAEAAKAIFPDHAVVTWSGGCGAVQKSDWSTLKNRDITIWPDNDKPGINAAAKIADILKEQDNSSVKIVVLPPTLPQKWDLADKIPDGIDVQEILAKATEPRLVQAARSPDYGSFYEKTFSFDTIYKHCETKLLSHMAQPEMAPLLTHAANETYKELKQWHQLAKISYDDKKLETQACLTAMYTVWAKDLLDTEKDKTDSLQKALEIGAIAGKLKIDDTPTRDQREIVLLAMQQYRRHESQIAEALKHPSATIASYTTVVQEEILRAATKSHIMTGTPLPSQIAKELIESVAASCNQANQHTPDRQTVRSIIEIVREQKVQERSVQTKEHDQINRLSISDLALQQQQGKDALLQQAVQQSNNLLAQKEQLQRGFER